MTREELQNNPGYWQGLLEIKEYNYNLLVSKMDEYISLLAEEIDSMAIIAHIHGWESTRHEKGKSIRSEIEELKKSLKI